MTGTKPLVLIVTIAILIGALVLLLPIIYDKFKDICVQNFEDFIDDLQRNAGCILRPGDGPVERKIDLLKGFSCIDYVFYDEIKGELNYKIRGKEQPVTKQTVQCDRDIKYFGFRKEDPPVVSKQIQKQQQKEQDDENWNFDIEIRNGAIILASEKKFMIQDIENIVSCIYNSCRNQLLNDPRIPDVCNSKLHGENSIKSGKLVCYEDDNQNSYLEYNPMSNLIFESKKLDNNIIAGIGLPSECGKSSSISDKYIYISSALTNINAPPCEIAETDTERNYCCTATTRSGYGLDCNFQAKKPLKIFAKSNNDRANPKVTIHVCGLNEGVAN